MSIKVLNTVIAVCSVAILSGCASKAVQTTTSAPSYKSQSIDDRLAKAATTAANAQENLARIQIARTAPSPSMLDETDLPEELKRPATIDWSGPAHEAAQKVAQLIGYSFKITGNRPSIPPMVHVSVKDLPAAKALEDIGLQAYPFGEVAVDPNGKRIEFRYLQSQQQPLRASGTSPSWGK